MRHAVLDLETSGFLEECDRIHSLVLRDVDTNEVMSCADQPGFPSIAEGLEVLKQCETVYGTNLIGFDRPVLVKLMGYEIPWEKCKDTLPISAMRWAHARDMDAAAIKAGKPAPTGKLQGRHSLKAWGVRLGFLKGAFGETSDFKHWSKEMQEYCERDTAVTRALVLHIRHHGVPQQAVWVEQELRRFLLGLERNGVPFHMEKATALQAKLSARREELRTELQRVFKPWYRPVRVKGAVDVKVWKKDMNRKGVLYAGDYSKVELVHFNPASRAHIFTRLMRDYGWKPSQFTPSGQPEINEKTILSLDQTLPGVALLSEFLLLEKRLGQLAEGDEAWLRHARKDGAGGGRITGLHHIHGGVIQSGTVTHRAAHIRPNLGQVPAVGKPHGAECRELFYVP